MLTAKRKPVSIGEIPIGEFMKPMGLTRRHGRKKHDPKFECILQVKGSPPVGIKAKSFLEPARRVQILCVSHAVKNTPTQRFLNSQPVETTINIYIH